MIPLIMVSCPGHTIMTKFDCWQVGADGSLQRGQGSYTEVCYFSTMDIIINLILNSDLLMFKQHN